MKVGWLTAFLDLPSASFDRGIGFWQAVTGYGLSPWRGDRRQFATLLPASGRDYLRVQNVGADRPRVHLDVHTGDVPGLVAAARAAGAAEIPGGDVPVLRSPAGLVFCAVADDGASTPPPAVQWTGGQRSVVDQVCFDLPPSRYDDETAFWERLTGWPRTDTDPSDEFERMPGAGALQVLLQRLDDDVARGRIHLDLACDGTDAEVERHLSLGATHVRDGRGWVTLRDPAGLEYCVTGRNPR